MYQSKKVSQKKKGSKRKLKNTKKRLPSAKQRMREDGSRCKNREETGDIKSEPGGIGRENTTSIMVTMIRFMVIAVTTSSTLVNQRTLRRKRRMAGVVAQKKMG